MVLALALLLVALVWVMGLQQPQPLTRRQSNWASEEEAAQQAQGRLRRQALAQELLRLLRTRARVHSRHRLQQVQLELRPKQLQAQAQLWVRARPMPAGQVLRRSDADP